MTRLFKWLPIAFGIAFIAAIIAIVAIEPWREGYPGRIAYDPSEIRVIDGDTFHTSADKVRLWGIDTPDRGDPGRDEAKEALTAIVEGAALVTCTQRPGSAGWSYDRKVARCWADRDDIAEALLAAGVAVEWCEYSGGFYGGEVCR